MSDERICWRCKAKRPAAQMRREFNMHGAKLVTCWVCCDLEVEPLPTSDARQQLEEIAGMAGVQLREMLGEGIGFSLILYDLEIEPGAVAYAQSAGVSREQAGRLLIEAGRELLGEGERVVATVDATAPDKVALTTRPQKADPDMPRLGRSVERFCVVCGQSSEEAAMDWVDAPSSGDVQCWHRAGCAARAKGKKR